MFDRIFVAGRAGIDRFEANGVAIPADRFDIVGRPQAAPIAVTDRPIADVPDDTKTVLYATTWRGIYTDANYSSLPSGDRIVAALLARGVRVIFRPHPNVSKHPPSSRQAARVERMLADDAAKTGRQHVYGPAATEAMSVVDCVNASDALIADISGIATDWLYSAKPFALTNSMGLSPAEFETEFPIARAAYVLDGELATVDTVLDKLLGDDPLAVTRRAIRGYYLGDIPPEAYADTFVETARRYVRGTPSVGAPHGAFEVSDEDQPVLRSRRSAPRIA
jgi:CDP-glycerol glycerophosphotransferase (TagB/SpsB family)